jgi:NADH dehydrogenase
MPVRHLLITGANGYIGAALVERALAQGLTVSILGRNDIPGQRCFPWRLGDPVPAEALDGVDAVIHLAHDWSDTGDTNLAGTRLLLEAARSRGLRVVFASSVSAREGALNRYGRIKYAIEGLLTAPAEIAARIGMVYGGPPRSQWGMLCRITGLTPVLPMLETGKPVQPIHLDDLCEGLLRLAALAEPGRAVYGLAASPPVAFGAMLAAIARHRHGRRLHLINIPLSFALAGIDLAARVPGLPRIDRERLLGLAGLPVIDTAESLDELGLTLRSLDAGLAPGAGALRRRLLGEGGTLLRYVLGRAPSPWAARRYVRALAADGEATPLDLPGRCPALLRMTEPLDDSPLRRRLYLATLIAEASPAATEVFHDHAGRPLPALLASLAGTALIEAVCLPIRLLAGRRK